MQSYHNPRLYEKTMNAIAEKAADAQALTIEKTMICRLFKSKKPKAVVYDHGHKLSAEPFKL